MSPAQLLNKLKPKTDVDRVLAAGFYLEKHSRQENFTANEIAILLRNAKRPPPKNPNDAVNQNIRKGLMMPAGDREGIMAFVLTSDGETEINERLTAAE